MPTISELEEQLAEYQQQIQDLINVLDPDAEADERIRKLVGETYRPKTRLAKVFTLDSTILKSLEMEVDRAIKVTNELKKLVRVKVEQQLSRVDVQQAQGPQAAPVDDNGAQKPFVVRKRRRRGPTSSSDGAATQANGGSITGDHLDDQQALQRAAEVAADNMIEALRSYTKKTISGISLMEDAKLLGIPFKETSLDEQGGLAKLRLAIDEKKSLNSAEELAVQIILDAITAEMTNHSEDSTETNFLLSEIDVLTTSLESFKASRLTVKAFNDVKQTASEIVPLIEEARSLGIKFDEPGLDGPGRLKKLQSDIRDKNTLNSAEELAVQRILGDITAEMTNHTEDPTAITFLSSQIEALNSSLDQFKISKLTPEAFNEVKKKIRDILPLMQRARELGVPFNASIEQFEKDIAVKDELNKSESISVEEIVKIIDVEIIRTDPEQRERESELFQLKRVLNDGLQNFKKSIITPSDFDSIKQHTKRACSRELSIVEEMIFLIDKECMRITNKYPSSDPRIAKLTEMKSQFEAHRDKYKTGEINDTQTFILGSIDIIKDQASEEKLSNLSKGRGPFIDFLHSLLKPFHWLASRLSPDTFKPTFFARKVEKNVAGAAETALGGLKAALDELTTSVAANVEKNPDGAAKIKAELGELKARSDDSPHTRTPK